MTTMTINLAVDLVAIIISMAAILLLFMFSRIEKEIIQEFLPMFLFNALTALSSMLALLFRGAVTPTATVIVPVANFGEFLFTILTSAALLHYLLVSIERAGHQFRNVHLFYIPYSFYILALIINVFHPVFYQITQENIYQRLPGYTLLVTAGILLVLENFIIYMRYRSTLPQSQKFSFLFYFIAPAAGGLIQAKYYGIAVIQLFTTTSILLMYVLIVQYAIDSYLKKQEELQSMHTKVMLSQMRPHFIFNVLTTISALCHNKAPAAESAILTFSRYLRGNIDCLSKTDLIPFKEEMEHVQYYIELEQLRFDDRVMADFELEDMDFMVPALSIQPLVENAVKHGITKKPEGGLIVISSVLENNHHVITIEDDGAGFDMSKPFDTSRVHVGLSNSRERMIRLLNASFDISSTPGEGTTITIRIPAAQNK